MIHKNIEVIADNAGGLTIQNTQTKAVANFGHKSDADAETLQSILDGGNMTGWDESEPEYYISDEYYRANAPSGGLNMLNESEIEDLLGSAK
jgi:hypothetical protein